MQVWKNLYFLNFLMIVMRNGCNNPGILAFRYLLDINWLEVNETF